MSIKTATVIIPTYNESGSIGDIVTYLFENTFKTIKNWNMKLLIVDGNSNDGTLNIIISLMKKYNNLNFIHEKQKDGIGAAYIKGFKYAIDNYKTDVVIEFDGDFQHPPESIPIMLNEIENGYDYVLGSRKIRGGSYPKSWGIKRNFLSRVGGLAVRLLLFFPFKEYFLITDPTTGLKATKVNDLFLKFNFDNLFTKSFGYKLELLFHMVSNKAKVKEIPLVFNIRKSGESKLTTQTPLEIFRTVFFLRFNDIKTLRFIKFCMVGLIGLIINAFFLEFFYKTIYVDYILYFFSSLSNITLLNILSIKSSWAAGLAAEIAIISNFILNNLWTFSSEKIKGFFKIIKKFLLFNLTSIGAVLIQFLLVGLSALIINESLYTRQLTLLFSVLFVIVPYNWLMYNIVIWKKDRV